MRLALADEPLRADDDRLLLLDFAFGFALLDDRDFDDPPLLRDDDDRDELDLLLLLDERERPPDERLPPLRELPFDSAMVLLRSLYARLVPGRVRDYATTTRVATME